MLYASISDIGATLAFFFLAFLATPAAAVRSLGSKRSRSVSEGVASAVATKPKIHKENGGWAKSRVTTRQKCL